MSSVPEITPIELKKELDGANPPVLVDVREDEELAICKLDGIVHIPLGAIPDRFAELGKDQDLVIICRGGVRSAKAAEFLLGQGYPRVRSMVGGMLSWADTVDPTVAKY